MAMALEPRPPAQAAEALAMAMALVVTAPGTEVPHQTPARPSALVAEARAMAMEQAEMTRIEANKSAHSGYCRRNAG